ncbi:hypothetical protein EMIT048CA2_80259 [Pseudomonas chlororaphis]
MAACLIHPGAWIASKLRSYRFGGGGEGGDKSWLIALNQ